MNIILWVMTLSFITHILLSYVLALLAIAFFTLLERKVLGYIQLRKGPNKVGIIGLPQPLADAAKLLTKEQTFPSLANLSPYLFAPTIGLFLALILWSIFPHRAPALFIKFGVLFFLCVSRVNVYVTLAAGWSSNSKYALLGAIRGVAQTISYEVRISLTLLAILVILCSFNLTSIYNNSITPIALLCVPLFIIWFTTTLAETNRTPFDFAEGESELVSGFNTEYSRGTFAIIFIAEYTNILIISLFSSIFFFSIPTNYILKDFILTIITLLMAFSFLWIRGTLPRIRYDRLIYLTWKGFLPFALLMLLFNIPINLLISWCYAGNERIALITLNTGFYSPLTSLKSLYFKHLAFNQKKINYFKWMIIIRFSSALAFFVPLVVLLITLIINARSFKDREKSSPFECGFDPKNSARLPFSTRFFLLAVIFIVFDIEIVLLLPVPLTSSSLLTQHTLIGGILFLLILILGLLHEWNEGSLDWS